MEHKEEYWLAIHLAVIFKPAARGTAPTGNVLSVNDPTVPSTRIPVQAVAPNAGFRRFTAADIPRRID